MAEACCCTANTEVPLTATKRSPAATVTGGPRWPTGKFARGVWQASSSKREADTDTTGSLPPGSSFKPSEGPKKVTWYCVAALPMSTPCCGGRKEEVRLPPRLPPRPPPGRGTPSLRPAGGLTNSWSKFRSPSARSSAVRSSDSFASSKSSWGNARGTSFPRQVVSPPSNDEEVDNDEEEEEDEEEVSRRPKRVMRRWSSLGSAESSRCIIEGWAAERSSPSSPPPPPLTSPSSARLLPPSSSPSPVASLADKAGAFFAFRSLSGS
mmetsp:Transcript_42754/g.84261  ORF Transcript_42754/g.84261 Transcript_42754/m.84261 type:complete len:266 (+) Transcript_42754:553-1350(+)